MKQQLRAILPLLILATLFHVVALASPPQVGSSSAETLALPDTDDGIVGSGPIRRYDWFRNLWVKRRSGFADRSVSEMNAVVFLGDSITQGWGDDFQGDFAELKVANRGISGDTTRGMLLRLDADVLSLQP